MGVILSSLFSEAKGGLNNIIIYTVKGQVRIRSKSLVFRDKKSPKQLLQRGKLKGALGLYQHLDSAFTAAWKEESQKTIMNACNLFIQNNIRNINTEGTIEDPAQLKISIGTLPLPSGIQMREAGEDEILVTWNFDSMQYTTEQYDDLLQIGVYGKWNNDDEKDKECIYYLRAARANRSEGQCRFSLSAFRAPLHFYACFKSLYTHEYSDSVYLGSK